MGGIALPYLGALGQMGYVPPNTIPNLSLWYNASASATVVKNVSTNNFQGAVVNGSSISSWIDLQNVAGPANTTGGASKNPTYTIPIQNGLGSVTYNSANSNNLDINPTSWAQNLSGFTVYVVARPTNFPASIFPLVTTGNTNFGMWWNGTNWSIGQSANNLGTVSVTNDTAKFHMYGMIFDGSQTGNANRLKFRYDRIDKTLTFTGTIGTTTGSIQYWFFGGNDRSVGATQGTYMNGYLGEVLIWTRALSVTEVAQVELYINTKWALGY